MLMIQNVGFLSASPVAAGRLRQLLLTLSAAALVALGAAAPAPAVAQSQGLLPDFTELVERVGPAVVNIRTTERARADARRRCGA